MMWRARLWLLRLLLPDSVVLAPSALCLDDLKDLQKTYTYEAETGHCKVHNASWPSQAEWSGPLRGKPVTLCPRCVQALGEDVMCPADDFGSVVGERTTWTPLRFFRDRRDRGHEDRSYAPRDEA